MRWSEAMRKRLIELAAEHGSTYAVAEAANAPAATLYRWYQEHEGFKAEIENGFEKHIESMASRARRILDSQLKRMEKDPSLFDLPTVLRTLTREDKRWSQTYRQQDVNVNAKTVIEQALEELDAQSKTMSEGN